MPLAISPSRVAAANRLADRFCHGGDDVLHELSPQALETTLRGRPATRTARFCGRTDDESRYESLTAPWRMRALKRRAVEKASAVESVTMPCYVATSLGILCRNIIRLCATDWRPPPGCFLRGLGTLVYLIATGTQPTKPTSFSRLISEHVVIGGYDALQSGSSDRIHRKMQK
jgi:hypothetical protein